MTYTSQQLHVRTLMIAFLEVIDYGQAFGKEKDGNHGKFIGFNLVIFSYKDFEKFTL